MSIVTDSAQGSRPTAPTRDFGEFVAKASPSLLRTAWLLCGDPSTAEELVQEALARVYPKWSRIVDGQPLAYTRRVLVNLNNDRWRQRLREVPRAEPVERAGPEDQSVEDRALLMSLLATLPPREREVVVLRHYDDLSETTVAELLGISVGTVKSTAHRALTTLRTR